MKKNILHREQFIPISIKEAWDFFSNPKNLNKITPKDMGFVVLTDLDDKPIYNGMRIDYMVRPLFRIPMHWTTEILSVTAPHQFIDKQVKGPYALWEHTHIFQEVSGGINMTDHVVYSLPLGWLGALAHKLIVKNKLESIFNFREETLSNYFKALKMREHVAS